MRWNLRDKPPTPAHFSKDQRRALSREVKRLSWQSRGVRWGVFAIIGGVLLLCVPVYFRSTRGMFIVEGSTVVFTLLWAVFCAIPTNRRNAMRVWAAHGLCTKCGYDLRGNDSGRCPECGRVWTAHGLCTKCGCDLRQIDSDKCPECGELRQKNDSGTGNANAKATGGG
jgi:hypothetical protein